jgi:hypothetical protein
MTFDISSSKVDIGDFELVQFVHRYDEQGLSISKRRILSDDATKKKADELVKGKDYNESEYPQDPLDIRGKQIDIGGRSITNDNPSVGTISATKKNPNVTRDQKKLHFWDVPTVATNNEDQVIVLDTFLICKKTKKVLYHVHWELAFIGGKASYPDDKRWGEKVKDGKFPDWALRALELDRLKRNVPNEEDGVWQHDDNLKTPPDVYRKYGTGGYSAGQD